MIYLFSDQPHEGVVHLPLFEIDYYPISFLLDSFDAIIFTSKNSVKALEQYAPSWKEKECYAIGEGTASFIKQCGGNLVFTCKDSYGDLFAKEIVPKLRDKRVLFPRAKEVVSSLFEILKAEQIMIEQRVVYETRCRSYEPSMAPKKNSTLIFTSPSTVQCFFKNFMWDESYRAIAIGKKTAATFPLHVKNVTISSKQSIEHCIMLAQ